VNPKPVALWSGQLESHTSINADLWLAMGYQSSPQGKGLGQSTVHSDRLERSVDDRIGAPGHFALRHYLRKCSASRRCRLSTKAMCGLEFGPSRGLWDFLRSGIWLARWSVQLLSISCDQVTLARAFSVERSGRDAPSTYNQSTGHYYTCC